MKPFLKIIFLAVLWVAAFTQQTFSQVPGDFGSITNGNWGSSSTWNTYNGACFCTATALVPTTADNVFITPGTTVVVEASPKLCKDLTVQSTGKLWTGNSAAGNLYVEVHGNIVCDGDIGAGATYDQISFDIAGANVTISGTGTFDAGKIYKNTSTNATSNLTINRKVNLRSSGTQIYNNTNLTYFNVTVGDTLNLISGNAAVDGNNGQGGGEQGGSFTVNGLMDVQGILYCTNNNNNSNYPCKWIVNGYVKANQIDANYITGNAIDSLSVNSGGKLELTGTGGTLPFVNFVITNHKFIFNTNSTVEYSGLGTQTIKTNVNFPPTTPANLSQYYNLIVSGSGTKSIASAMGVKNDITIRDSLGAAVLSVGTNNINIGGNWTNYNQSGFTEGTVPSVTFNGLGNQYITCPGGEIFNSVTLSNAGAATGIYFNNDVTLAKALAFFSNDNAPLYLNKNKLILQQAVPGAIVIFLAGAGFPNRYIVSETAVGSANYATNPSIVQWTMGTSSAAYVFPFGVAGTKIPVTIGKQASGSTLTVSVSTRATATSNNLPWDTLTNVPYVSNMNSPYVGVSPSADSSVIDRWWDITTASNIPLDSLIFTYRGIENTMNPIYQTDTIFPQNWTGSSWSNHHFINQAVPTFPLGVTAGTGSVTVGTDTLVSAAPWVLVGKSHRLLPVTWLSFTADLKDEKVFAQWSTASEINNDYFTLEKSKDGKIFEAVGKVKGAGNSTEMHEYRFIDSHPFPGLSYYRLKQTDFDGHFSYNQMVPVFNKDKNITWYMFPNPATDQIKIASTADGLPNTVFQLFNPEGSLIKSMLLDMKSQSIITVPLNGYSTGIYIGKITDDYHQQVFKIVKN